MTKMSVCHPLKLLHAKGLCKNCYHKQLIQSNPVFKKTQVQNQSQWHIKNPTKRLDYQLRSKLAPDYRQRRQLSTARYRNQKLNITEEQYQALLTYQNNQCGACYQDLTNLRRSLDHDHSTGIVRGFLCHKCNLGLGLLRDDPSIILGLFEYLHTTPYSQLFNTKPKLDNRPHKLEK